MKSIPLATHLNYALILHHFSCLEYFPMFDEWISKYGRVIAVWIGNLVPYVSVYIHDQWYTCLYFFLNPVHNSVELLLNVGFLCGTGNCRSMNFIIFGLNYGGELILSTLNCKSFKIHRKSYQQPVILTRENLTIACCMTGLDGDC